MRDSRIVDSRVPSRLTEVRWRFPQAFSCTLRAGGTSCARASHSSAVSVSSLLPPRYQRVDATRTFAVPAALRVLLRLEYGSPVPIAADPHNAPFVAPREQECDRRKLRGLERTMLSAAH